MRHNRTAAEQCSNSQAAAVPSSPGPWLAAAEPAGNACPHSLAGAGAAGGAVVVEGLQLHGRAGMAAAGGRLPGQPSPLLKIKLATCHVQQAVWFGEGGQWGGEASAAAATHYRPPQQATPQSKQAHTQAHGLVLHQPCFVQAAAGLVARVCVRWSRGGCPGAAHREQLLRCLSRSAGQTLPQLQHGAVQPGVKASMQHQPSSRAGCTPTRLHALTTLSHRWGRPSWVRRPWSGSRWPSPHQSRAACRSRRGTGGPRRLCVPWSAGAQPPWGRPSR